MIATLLLAAISASAAPAWNDKYADALAKAQASGKPVLMDFQAPWCYSCYYMEKHVLDGDAFAKASARVVLLKLDVDNEEGHALKEKFKVSFLPSYLLVSPKEEPVGRIVGEQTEADFLKQLDGLLGGGSADPLDQAVAALKKSLAANDFEKATADISRLAPDRLKILEGRRDWRLLMARLELMRAVKAKWAGGVDALKRALALDDSCDTAYDSAYAEEIVDLQKPEERKKLLELERASLEKLADARLFVAAAKRCADFRTGVETLVDVYEKQGEKGKKDALLARTLAFLDEQGLKPGDDRNFDDNKRFFLELQGDESKLGGYYSSLIETYPADYVYAQRWAKWLQAHGKAKEALPFSEKADKLAYGANRLAVTAVRAKILADLGRKPEALALLKRDAKAGRAAFPKEAADLETLEAQLSKKK
jgi:thiol-disulfide isomerase/thioredoxin